MYNIGVEFKLNDGTSEFYDPVNSDKPYEKIGDVYKIYHSCSEYELEASQVKSIITYDLCESCQFELKEGFCKNYNCEQYFHD